MLESSPRVVPCPPFADWPSGVSFASGLGMVWFIPDATLCMQTYGSRIDLAAAKSYVATVRAIRDVEKASIERAGGLRLYQDCRSIRVLDRDARVYMSEAARADFDRWSMVFNKIEVAPQAPIVRVSIQLIGLAARQMGLPWFDLSVDLARELERDGVRAPRADAAYAERHATYARVRDHLRDA